MSETLCCLNLRESSFGDLDSLLSSYMHDQHEPSLESSCDRAYKDRSESIRKGNDKESNPSFKQQLEEGGTQNRSKKTKKKADKPKEEGQLTVPSLQPIEASGSMRSFQKNNGAAYAGRKGTRHKLAGGTSTSSTQQQHQQHQAWSRPSNPRTSSINRSFKTEASASALQCRLAHRLISLVPDD